MSEHTNEASTAKAETEQRALLLFRETKQTEFRVYFEQQRMLNGEVAPSDVSKTNGIQRNLELRLRLGYDRERERFVKRNSSNYRSFIISRLVPG